MFPCSLRLKAQLMTKVLAGEDELILSVTEGWSHWSHVLYISYLNIMWLDMCTHTLSLSNTKHNTVTWHYLVQIISYCTHIKPGGVVLLHYYYSGDGGDVTCRKYDVTSLKYDVTLHSTMLKGFDVWWWCYKYISCLL